MEVHHARAFLAVAEELHFGRAAQRVNLTQPALSRLVQGLERTLGAALFDRTTRKVALTPAGEALVPVAEDLVRDSERAGEAVRGAVTGETGRVRLGFASASAIRPVARLAREVQSRAPGLRLELESAHFSPQGLERVLEGELDLCLGRWDYMPPAVDALVLAQERLVVALPPGHRLWGAATVALADLAEDRWITIPGGPASALGARLPALAQAAGFVPRIVQQAPDSWSQVVLVDAGVGLALTVDSVRENIRGEAVGWAELADAGPPLDVQLIWRAGRGDPAVARVVAIAAALFGGEGQGDDDGQDGPERPH